MKFNRNLTIKGKDTITLEVKNKETKKVLEKYNVINKHNTVIMILRFAASMKELGYEVTEIK